MHPYVVTCYKFPLHSFVFLSFLFLLSVDACHMHRDQVDPSYAKECLSYAQRSSRSISCKRRNKTLYDSAWTDDSSVRKHRRALRHSNKKNVHLSCWYCIFCPVCKGNKFLCCRFYTNHAMSTFPLQLF